MKLSRFSEEPIIGFLKEQESGVATADVCRRHGISRASFYKWKAKYGGLEVSDARRPGEADKRDGWAHRRSTFASRRGYIPRPRSSGPFIEQT